mmetsp:Transcript_22273/g.34592  ORF Transcript_22273/g.34592 Transcript_22273/m.34592 type:complete len:341 (-) Transcript_22273:179-1201(-)
MWSLISLVLSFSLLIASQEAPAHDVTVFYHAYAHENNASLSLPIVTEQLKGLWRSVEVETVNFITIDESKELSNSITNLCHELNFQCRHLGAYTEGNEEITLQHLHSFCSENQQKSVIYIHTKGAFHNHEVNSNLRAFLLRGLSSHACTFTDNCDVCASRICPIPHLHVPGNMWRARCDYISTLIPPKDFIHAMDNVKTALDCAGETHAVLSTFGFGRYALEHWINSHPKVRPCDVMNVNYCGGYIHVPERPNVLSLSLNVGPRFSSVSPLQGTRDGMCGGKSMLQQHLTEWRVLYNITRPPTSLYYDWLKMKERQWKNKGATPQENGWFWARKRGIRRV